MYQSKFQVPHGLVGQSVRLLGCVITCYAINSIGRSRVQPSLGQYFDFYSLHDSILDIGQFVPCDRQICPPSYFFLRLQLNLERWAESLFVQLRAE